MSNLKRSRLGDYLDSLDKREEKELTKRLNTKQELLVLSLVNDVLAGKRIAANFVISNEGWLVEAGTRKVVEPEN